jgi:hypothetical protein
MPTFGLVRRLAALVSIATQDAHIVTAAPGDRTRRKAWWEIVGILTTTFSLLAAAVYVILSPNYDEGAKKWASALVGGISGYWLK